MAAKFTAPLLSSPSCPQVRATTALTAESAWHWELFAIHAPASPSHLSGFHQKQSPCSLGMPIPTCLPQPSTALLSGLAPSCSAHPPVYAETAHNPQDIHLALVLQLLAPNPGGNEGAGAANARAAGQTDTAV